MLRYLTENEMRSVEQAAFSLGLPSVIPMENAARAAAELALKLANGGRILILCGSGNNGADGLAAARILTQAGARVRVCLWGEHFSAESSLQQKYLEYLKIPVEHCSSAPDMSGFSLILDAFFGIGLSRPLSEDMIGVVRAVNGSGIPVLSLDIPSGMDATTGEIRGDCIHADHTVTFHQPKLGMALTDRPEYLGQVHAVPVGFADEPLGIPAYEEKDWEAIRYRRPKNAHKGMCGRVLIYGGDPGMAGAAAMCALAALKAGAGLVTVLCDRESLPALQCTVPNAMCVCTDSHLPLPGFDTTVIGCGLRKSEAAVHWTDRILSVADACVLDAGALDLLQDLSSPLPARCVLTPHWGEGARLLDTDILRVRSDPLEALKALTSRYQRTVALKSAVTLISDGERIAMNTVGSPALAKGGSGDALAGILAASLCVIPDPFEAARAACLRMGIAGRRGEERLGTDGLLTEEMLSFLP